MTGEQVAGNYYDETTPGFQALPEQHGNFGDTIHETGFPTSGSLNYETRRPVSYGSENRTGFDSRNRETGDVETEHLHETGSYLGTGNQRPGDRKTIEVEGKQLTEEQFAALTLFNEGQQTLSALAVGLTAMGRFGRVDNNRSQRLRRELEALGLIQVKG